MELPCRLFILGPPATGKSTLGASLTAGLLSGYRYLDLDSLLRMRFSHELHAGELGDEVINAAAAALLETASTAPAVIELPHHDYIVLLQVGALKMTTSDCVIILTSKYSELVTREMRRDSKVPHYYIARCLGAASALCEYLAHADQTPWVAIDSSLLSADQVLRLATDFLRRQLSPSLKKISVAPMPERPDLGGSLIGAVEWDWDLVRLLSSRHHIRTVLDVGCGAGLTLDYWKAQNVECWGIDGNLRILDGPCQTKERLLVADFTKQWLEWPLQADLVWCVEVLEHVPERYEHNVIRTISHNAGRLAFVTAAAAGQPGYHHVNCKPQEYWIEALEAQGLQYLPETPLLLATLSDSGPFGKNYIKRNGMIFERRGHESHR